MKKIGLLGGSFDPPHKGHLYISLEAKRSFALDEVWSLVTPQNPLKIIKPATYKERIKNCKKLTISNPIIINRLPVPHADFRGSHIRLIEIMKYY